jgi:apolipoprotein N-acyltransferase
VVTISAGSGDRSELASGAGSSAATAADQAAAPVASPLWAPPDLWRIPLAILAGCGPFLGGERFNIEPLAWLTIPILLLCIEGATPRRAFWLGLLSGTVTNAGGFYWIIGLLERFGHMPTFLAAPIFLLMVAAQGGVYALFAWGTRALMIRGAPLLWTAPLVFVSVDYVFPMLFPWDLATTQYRFHALVQIAEITGTPGIGFVMALGGTTAYVALARWRAGLNVPWRWVGASVAALAATLLFGVMRLGQVDAARAAAPKLKVGVVQANVGIVERGTPELSAKQLRTHQQLSSELQSEGADLVVWPEGSYPWFMRRSTDHDFSPADPRRILRGFDIPVLMGALTVDMGRRGLRPYNSALLFDGKGQRLGLYDKNYLLLFGEYVPFYDELQVGRWLPEAGNLQPGKDVRVLELPGKDGRAPVRIGPLICYEDILPRFARRVAAGNPQIFINITNDAWFGKTAEPYLHMSLTTFRAIESRRDMVRAVNTGVSTYIDAAGRVIAEGPVVDPPTEPDAPPVKMLRPMALLEGRTVYGYIGDSFAVLVILGLLELYRRTRGQRSRSPGAPARPTTAQVEGPGA